MALKVATSPLIAVTGAGGFLGRHLTGRLRRDGFRVRGVVRPGRPPCEDVDEVVFADLEEPASCRAAVAGCQGAVLLAASGGGFHANTGRDYELFTRNVACSLNVLDACADGEVERVVHVSSSAVYGDRVGVLDEDDAGPPFSRAERGFGSAKWLIEEQVRMGTDAGKVEGVIVRPTNPYGPFDGLDARTAHFVPAMIIRLLGRPQVLELAGSIDGSRNLVHASDVVGGISAALTNGRPGAAYNLGAPEDTPLTQVLNRLFDVLGLAPDVRAPASTGSPSSRTVSLERSAAELGYRPTVDIDSGLEDTVAWYREVLDV